MIVLLPTTDPQDFNVFARRHELPAEDYDVIIRSEETKKDTSLKVALTYDGVVLYFVRFSFDFKEGRFYTIRTYHPTTGALLNYSKIYATAQTDFPKYSVLDDYYTTIDKPKTDFIVKKPQ